MGGYTIETKLGTLYKPLPKGYMLKGIIKKIESSFYQNDDNVLKLSIERISHSPKGCRLRNSYLLWFRLSNETYIK